ncbi:MAG: EamA family transporter [Candidatus Eremiobacteraeota bacterium]|nr:EamA family transporter [Candidatus Eremiobacteraeota bacterium]MCW5872557.1 EamA family transporter [Candidatus Eremiobacteraeota bacterium]
MNTWQGYALGSAFFAALTAILGKLGVATINSHLATFVRTVVILIMTGAVVTYQRKWDSSGLSSQTLTFLVLSGLATGLSWLCYYRALQLGNASQVAPVDKLSVALSVLLAVVFLGEKLTLKTGLGVLLILLGSLVMVL